MSVARAEGRHYVRAILTYHSIDPSGSPISCHPDVYDQHVRWLASGRVKVTTIDELVTLPASADAVAVTFDDAFVNFGDLAGPKLLAHGIPVTVFVATDHVGATNAWRGVKEPGTPHLPILGWPALVRLQSQGVSLGAHSRTHPDLTRVSRSQLQDEVRGSADIIERETGSRPSAFAYPYGRFDSTTAALVSDVYRFGCTVEFRPLGDSVRPALLPRLDMYYFQPPERLETWGTPAFSRLVGTRHRLRRIRQQWLEMMDGVLR